MADSLLDRCSGGRFKGWVSGSIFFFLDEDEPGSVEWRPNGRSGRDLESRDDGDSARGMAELPDKVEEFLRGGAAAALVGGFVGDFDGEEG